MTQKKYKRNDTGSSRRAASGEDAGRSRRAARRGLTRGNIISLVIMVGIIIVLSLLIYMRATDRNNAGTNTTSATATTTAASTAPSPVTTAPESTAAPTTQAPDTTPPVIEGVQDITAIRGNTIAYKAGITVTDDTDPAPVLTVDNSAVDTNTLGTYTVIYTATDASGNTSTASATVTIEPKEIGEENLDELTAMAQKIVDENIDADGSDLRKLNEAFWWVKSNMLFGGSSDKESWINEAIRGINEGRGDCFTFFAVLKALMTVMGFETVDVQRAGGESNHYWSLVKYNGEYYHIDSCPRSVEHDKYWYCFLRTDQELLDWSQDYDGYYYFDTSLYPDSATEPLNLDMQHG